MLLNSLSIIAVALACLLVCVCGGGQIKVSSNASFNLALLREKTEDHFPGLASTHYKMRYQVGEKVSVRLCHLPVHPLARSMFF
jgi:hypothetical protein